MKSEKKFHNPDAVAAKLRSGAGPHRATREETPCNACGAPTGSRSAIFCAECDVDACDEDHEP